METSYYLLKLQEELSLKQRHNPHYSLRAYARDLGLHPSTMSKIIKGQRPLPLKDSQRVVAKLALGPKEKTLFMESLLQNKVSLDNIKISNEDERFMLDESFHSVIAEWEHYALLELFKFEGFECTDLEVAQRLDLTENRAGVVINNLMTSGLLKHDESGKLVKAHQTLRTTEDVTSVAIRESHTETLLMGLDKLEKIEVELRDFSATTVAVDPDKLPEAKAIIREFRQKMATLLRDGEKKDVYKLAIQFFPLTPTTKLN